MPIQNIWWAVSHNLIAIPLAAGALVMSLSNVIVAINAQLLGRDSLDVAA